MKANFDDAKLVLKQLSLHNHQAFLAGGCVRDMLLNRPVNDYDITTSATPEQVQVIFDKTVPVGASFGVVKVIIEGRELDVATFRTDGKYSDNRRPDSVAYTSSPEEDVKRRDFTINALLSDAEGNITDYVGGAADLKARVIRCVGNPEERFGEDSLRMMRAIRFASKLGFTMDKATEEALVKRSSTISNVSKERITDELSKILTGNNVDIGFWILNKTLIWHAIFGNEITESNRWNAMMGLSKITQEDSFETAWASILANVHIYSHKLLNDKLVLTNAQTRDITRLLEAGASLSNFAGATIANKRIMRAWEDWDKIVRFLSLTQHISKFVWSVCGAFNSVEEILSHAETIKQMGWPGPLITGEDLIAWGWEPGSSFGDMLDEVRNAQLAGELQDKSQVNDFLIKQYPAAPRIINGQLVDGMRRRRYVAVCKNCSRVMSFTAIKNRQGKTDWNSTDDRIGVSSLTYGIFAHCLNCYTRKKRSKFIEAIE